MNPKVIPPKKPFNPGRKIFGWEAHDYHPHKHGALWIIIFSAILLGGALWAILANGDWLMAFVFFLVAGMYFWAHRKGIETHQIQVFEQGMLVDQKLFPLEKLGGYWFIYDETVSVINFQLKSRYEQKISLQMGEMDPDFFRQNFARIGLEELPDKKESLLDLWIRALKL